MNVKEQYELMVKELLEVKLPFEGYDKIESFQRKRYQGKSGAEHQFDVTFELKSELIKQLYIVECKELKNKVTKKDMIDFAFKKNDISANKAIFVTTNGYQKGAEEIAKSENIALILAKDGMQTPLQGDIPLPFMKEELFQLFPSFNILPEQEIQKLQNTTQCFSGFEEFGAGKENETTSRLFDSHTCSFADLPGLNLSIENALTMIFLDTFLSAANHNGNNFENEIKIALASIARTIEEI